MHSCEVGLGETPVKTAAGSSSSAQNGVSPLSLLMSDIALPTSTNGEGDKESPPTTKRTNYITWDDYFMAVALLSAQRSKDPSTQVGACIVNPANKIVGIGYNGMPVGCDDDVLPWAKVADDPLDTKYPYVCHAEMNAVLNRNSSDVTGCRMYVALFPCNECAKIIIQAGIREVVYLRDKADKPEMQASRRLFDMVKVTLRQFKPTTTKICIDLSTGLPDDVEAETKS